MYLIVLSVNGHAEAAGSKMVNSVYVVAFLTYTSIFSYYYTYVHN